MRRFGEVVKLFLDAGHVVISTSNVFNHENHADLRLLAEPSPVVEILVSDDPEDLGNPDIRLSVAETKRETEAANTICKYLKDKKILTGHNFSI